MRRSPDLFYGAEGARASSQERAVWSEMARARAHELRERVNEHLRDSRACLRRGFDLTAERAGSNSRK